MLPPEVAAVTVCSRSIQQFLMIKGHTILEVIYDYGICKVFNIVIWSRIIPVINDGKLATLSLDLESLYHE